MNVDMTHATTGATCLSVTARTYNMSHTRKRRSMSQHAEHVRACSAIVIAAQRMVWASAGRRTWMLDGGGDVYSNVVREEALGRGRAAWSHPQHNMRRAETRSKPAQSPRCGRQGGFADSLGAAHPRTLLALLSLVHQAFFSASALFLASFSSALAFSSSRSIAEVSIGFALKARWNAVLTNNAASTYQPRGTNVYTSPFTS